MNFLAKSVIVHCAQLGVEEWVICPGARNVELLKLLSQATGVRLWTHFDERSAGFFALGRIQATGRPVAVLTTSGTAVAELLPAVIEAHYQGRPLLVVSADREPEFRGTGAPQAIEQVGIFSSYASPCFDIQKEEDLSTLADLSKTPLLTPLHLNVCLPEPTLDSTLAPWDVEVNHTPPQAPFRENIAELIFFLKNEGWKGLVVLLGGLEPEEQDPILWLLEQLEAPVLADATSGLRECLGSLLLTDGDKILKDKPPAAVLRIGDIPAGRFWRDLESLPEIPVFSLTRTGYSGLAQRPSQVIKGEMERIVKAMGEVYPVGDAQDYLPLARKRAGINQELLVAYPESEQAFLYHLSLYASMSPLIYLGNSMPIREWNLFAQYGVETPNVRANRGANGIDGQISTFLGASADLEQSWGVFGDLTTLYDANAAAQAPQLPAGRRVAAVINNQGGRIFERLPKAAEMSERLRELLIQPHPWSVAPLAQLWNAHYKAVHSVDDLDFEPEEGLTFLEIFPDGAQTEQFWQQYHRS